MDAYAPGRVNLIGDHTDYSGGLVCPMAIDLGTSVEVAPGGDVLELVSDADPAPARIPLDITEPARLTPPWARYVAGVVAVLRPSVGGRGHVRSTLPLGGGLSSSAALEVATALALGADGSDGLALAMLCQRAEQLASGVPCGIMDQLVCATGQAGHALLIDCTTFERTPVRIPGDVEVLVVNSGERRALATSAYALRRREVEQAAAELGASLRDVAVDDIAAISDPTLRRRARHVATENARVTAFAAALGSGDVRSAGQLMADSHVSLRDDFEVSTTTLDGLVDSLCRTRGVWGARLTGAGFGGCVVALAAAGTAKALTIPGAVVVRAEGGASVRG
ncbi:MAG: galactokinase [Acidimicrobiales bacterium]